MSDVRIMYDLVRKTREVLFSYCETLPPDVYTWERVGISHGSIRDIHLHVADCYQLWLEAFGLGGDARTRKRANPADYPDVAAVRGYFADVDALVDRFLARYESDLQTPLTGRVRWEPEPITVTALWLLTHTITHEFHHKGQMVLFGREAGHPAPDSDLILP